MTDSRISHTDTEPGHYTTVWTVQHRSGKPPYVSLTQTRTIDNPFDSNGPRNETTYPAVPVVDGEPQWPIQPPAWFHQAAVAIIGGAK